MDSPLKLYARMSALFVALMGVVCFNVVVWGLHRHPTPPVLHVPGANAARGRGLIQEYGCGSCHMIPGVRGATGNAGPRLDRVREQLYVAGILPNNPPNLASWIADPQEADPQTAMPDLGVSVEDARDIAEYLYQLP